MDSYREVEIWRYRQTAVLASVGVVVWAANVPLFLFVGVNHSRKRDILLVRGWNRIFALSPHRANKVFLQLSNFSFVREAPSVALWGASPDEVEGYAFCQSS